MSRHWKENIKICLEWIAHDEVVEQGLRLAAAVDEFEGIELTDMNGNLLIDKYMNDKIDITRVDEGSKSENI